MLEEQIFSNYELGNNKGLYQYSSDARWRRQVSSNSTNKFDTTRYEHVYPFQAIIQLSVYSMALAWAAKSFKT